MKHKSEYKVPIHIEEQRRIDDPEYDNFVYQSMLREFLTTKIHATKLLNLEVHYSKLDKKYLDFLLEGVNKGTVQAEVLPYYRHLYEVERVIVYRLIINYKIV